MGYSRTVTSKEDEARFDFVIVGSGAGGGPLAANLAEAGFRVLLLEAGTDHQCSYYDVPIMQARASEDEEMCWDFFVRHYSSDEAQRRDSKFIDREDGVLYPRGATLGGSTAVSALVTVYPHNSDWDRLAEITGDSDWNADAMRRRFERIEQWQGPDVDPSRPAVPGDGSRHGFDGWLKVRRADPKLAGREPWFLDIIGAIEETSRERFGTPPEVPLPNDPNDWRIVSERREGMSFIPVAVGDGVRNGARERILAAQRAHPDRLTIRYKALVTRVQFEGDLAVGVEYLAGEHLYDADPGVARAHEPPSKHQVFAAREVILAGGAFNTPQIL
jgi:choline dehydrogenase